MTETILATGWTRFGPYLIGFGDDVVIVRIVSPAISLSLAMGTYLALFLAVPSLGGVLGIGAGIVIVYAVAEYSKARMLHLTDEQLRGRPSTMVLPWSGVHQAIIKGSSLTILSDKGKFKVRVIESMIDRLKELVSGKIGEAKLVHGGSTLPTLAGGPGLIIVATGIAMLILGLVLSTSSSLFDVSFVLTILGIPTALDGFFILAWRQRDFLSTFSRTMLYLGLGLVNLFVPLFVVSLDTDPLAFGLLSASLAALFIGIGATTLVAFALLGLRHRRA